MPNLLIVTGASRGFGRALAIHAPPQLLDKGSRIVLIARNKDLLQEVSQQVKGVQVVPLPLDLADLSQLSQVLAHVSDVKWDRIYLFNNAGSLGKLARLADQTPQDIHEAIQLNLTSPMALTSILLKQFEHSSTRFYIINISSLAA